MINDSDWGKNKGCMKKHEDWGIEFKVKEAIFHKRSRAEINLAHLANAEKKKGECD